MDSNFQFLVARPSNRHGRSDRFLETWEDLLGNRRFESISLQRRVWCEPEPSSLGFAHQEGLHPGQRSPEYANAIPARFPTASGATARAQQEQRAESGEVRQCRLDFTLPSGLI